MDVREKLVEQLREVLDLTPPICAYQEPEEIELFGKKVTVYCKPFEQFQELLREAADYIAHGATVQDQDGCDFCKKFDFAGARAEFNKYGAHISLAICNTKFLDEERFKFCPMCGRRLPQPPKGE